MADIREIRVTVNSSQANASLTDLDQRLNRTTNAFGNLSNTVRQSSGSAVSEADKFIASLKRQAEQAGKTRSQIAEMNAARLGPAAQASAAPYIAQLKAQEEALKKVGHAAGGVNGELFVLAHELSQGNFKDFGGSLMVLAQQSGGVTGALKGVVALITPMTAGLALAAAGVAFLGAAFYKGTQDAKEFRNALALTNNFAGLTSGAMVAMAKNTADATHSSYSDASEAIMGLATTGKFTASQISALTPSILNFSKLSGQSIEEASKRFAQLSTEPTKTAKELDSSMHFLSAGQMLLVENYEKLGDKTSAAKVITEALTAYWNGDAKEALDKQVTYWGRLTHAVSEYWNETARHISGNDTNQEKLTAAVQKRADLMSGKGIVVARGAKGAPIMMPESERAERLKQVNDEIATLGKAIADGQKKLYETNKKNETDLATKSAIDFMSPFLGKLPMDPAKQTEAWNKSVVAYKKARDAFAEGSPERGAFKTDAEIDQAGVLFKQSLINPVDEQNRIKSYKDRISNLDEFIKDEQQSLQFRQAMINAAVAGNKKTQEQALKETYDAQQAELKQEIKYNDEKIAEANKRVKQNPKDEEALQNVRDFGRKKRELENQMTVNTEEFKAKEAANTQAIADIYDKLVKDIDKSKADATLSFNKEMNRYTMTTNEAALADTSDAITAKYVQAKTKALDDYKSKHATGSAEEMKSIQALSQAEADELAVAKERWAQRIAMQEDWKTAATTTFKQYVESAGNVASMTSSGILTVMGTLENSLATFFKTFKFSLTDFALAIEDQLAQIAAKQTAALLVQAAPGAIGAIGSLFGGAKAGGGDVDAGKTYWVGENGPEKFVAPTNGTIIPSSLTSKTASASTSISPTINLGGIHVSGAGYSPDQAQAIGTHVSNQVMTRVLDELRYNGMLSSRGR